MRVDGQLVKSGAEVVTSLPTSDLFYGREVVLSTDDSKYIYFNQWTRSSGASDIDTFLELTDTPSNYTGQANKQVTVKSDETGLEFIDQTANISTFLGLTDTPTDYTGQANKLVAVNAGESALEFITAVATDELVKVSANDTTGGYLTTKLVAGSNITLTENNDGGNETLTITSAGGSGGGGLTAANIQGQMLRSMSNNPDDYEWIDENLWIYDTTGTRPVFRLGDFFNLIQRVDFDIFGGIFCEGSIFAFFDVDGEDVTASIDCSGEGVFANRDFSQGQQFGLFDVFANDANFNNNVWIFGNCEASSYTQMGVPLSAIILDEAVEEVATKYEDKYIESAMLNAAAGATNILMSFTDLVVGNWYKVKAGLLLKWIAGNNATISYDLMLKGISSSLRKVPYEEEPDDGDTSTQSYTFDFSFQATEQAINLVLQTDTIDHSNIDSGEVLGLGMTVEEFNPDVRQQTTEW